MTDQENKALYIAEQCRKAGMTLAGAAGVIANIEAESAFKSNNLQDAYESRLGMNDEMYTSRVDNGSYLGFVDDSAGYGLCQWTAASRKKLMLNFHRMRGKSIGDFQTQVDCMLSEIPSYNGAWIACTSSNDPFECGYRVCKYYEIPADTENQANYRGKLAQKWYDWISGAMEQGETSDVPENPKPDPAESQSGVVGKMKLRNIDKGINGWPEVWLLQSALKTRGYNVVCNGSFDEDLDKKLRQFQKDAKLSVDGVAGPMTWAAVLKFE